MPPWWPMYLFWGPSNSNFCAGFFLRIFGGGWKTGSNWFLLSQTFNQKKILSLTSSRFWTKYFFFLRYDDVYRAEGHMEVDIGVKQIWRKKLSQNLDDGNMPRFFQHWRFLRKLQLWLLMVDFLRYCAFMFYTPKFLYDLHKYFRFSSTNFNVTTKLCKWAMT